MGYGVNHPDFAGEGDVHWEENHSGDPRIQPAFQCLYQTIEKNNYNDKIGISYAAQIILLSPKWDSRKFTVIKFLYR